MKQSEALALLRKMRKEHEKILGRVALQYQFMIEQRMQALDIAITMLVNESKLITIKPSRH